MKIGLGLSYFNCVKEIPRCLDPLYKHFYKIYAVDGRYINYEDAQGRDYSEDGTTELLQKRYPNVVIEKVKPTFQPDKRQKYFDMAGEDNCDYLIVWDSDDIVHPDYQNWNKLFKNLQAYSKMFPDYRIFKMLTWIPDSKTWKKAYNYTDSNLWTPYIRIHKEPANMRYCLFCHYWWAPKDASDEDIILKRKPVFISDHTIDGVRLTTDSALRGRKQLKDRNNWAWNNIHEEKRRVHVMQNKLLKTKDPNHPEWLKGEYNKFNGYYRYDKKGRPISKICEEDGTLV